MNRNTYRPIIGLLCIAMTIACLSSCKDDEEEEVEPYVETRVLTKDVFVAAEGGAVNVKWAAAPEYKGFDFYILGWYRDKTNQSIQVTGSEDNLEITLVDDTIKGEWFTMVPHLVSQSVYGAFCDGGILSLEPNFTGVKRCLRIHMKNAPSEDAYVFQECEELPADPEDSNED